AGFDLTLLIAQEAGQWSVKGTVEKNGGVVGTYVGEGVALVGGRLAFQRKFTKKPANNWDDKDDVTLSREGDTLVSSAVTKSGQKTVRYFARVADETKTAAKTPGKEPAKPNVKAQLEEKLVGTWKGGAGRRFEEYWTVTQDGTALKITGTYWKGGQQVGSCHGTNISYGKDHLTFRR